MNLKDLNEAADYIHHRCRQFARFGVWTKEKYGTLRVSTTCAYFTEYDFLHHIVYPGHVSYHWPIWFRQYIDWPLGKVLKAIGVIWMVNEFQLTVLKFFWRRAAKKWPSVSKEILCGYNSYFGDKA